MLRNKMSGFTLIELMVVIVIIGVLASLAIPRFTEASSKAKVAEAPRVLASYESGYLAALAETASPADLTDSSLIFEAPQDSKWFSYAVKAEGADACSAAVKGAIGKLTENAVLKTKYDSETNGGSFKHTSNEASQATKMVPNFCNPGACAE
jgi:prepilin-type N-terminal cleavage/methylation domain-containing protein